MIEKKVFRDQVRSYLKSKMITGNISFGERISLPSISKELNVSITPIREALTQLEHSNIIELIPNRGFFLPELKKEEAEEIYPIIATLEKQAIQNSLYNKSQLKKLYSIQKKMSGQNISRHIVKSDFEFHEALLEPYKNNIAKRIINDLKTRVFLYDKLYWDHASHREDSLLQHESIIRDIEKGNVFDAANKVYENWMVGLDFLRNFLSKTH